MRLTVLPLTLLLAAGSTGLMAQSVTVGMAFDLLCPTGDFNQTTYPANSAVLVPQKEGYDLGVGAHFFLGFPVSRQVAFRVDFSGTSTNGSNTAPGYRKVNTRHGMFGLGAGLELYPEGGSAFRHQGLYFLGGVSADFERFDRSFGDVNYDYTMTDRKSRMGANVGLGHSWGRQGGLRFTLEATYHKTLTGIDKDYQIPAADFVKIGFGMVF